MFHIRKFTLRTFESSAQEPTGCINGWKVYGWCSTDNLGSCELLQRIEPMDIADARHLINGMAKLMRLACVGKPLQGMYDSKKCHETLTFTRANGQEQKVHRIRPGGDVRIYFCYGADKSIIVFYGLSKRKDKLTTGEEGELKLVCEAFLTAQEQNQLKILEIT